MPLAEWPADVPHRSQREGWQTESPFPDPLDTDMESGDVESREVYSVSVGRFAYSIYMTAAQVDDFKTFVHTTLVKGTAEFLMQVWTPTGYAEKTCRLISKPRYRLEPLGGNHFAVRFTLQVRDW